MWNVRSHVAYGQQTEVVILFIVGTEFHFWCFPQDIGHMVPVNSTFLDLAASSNAVVAVAEFIGTFQTFKYLGYFLFGDLSADLPKRHEICARFWIFLPFYPQLVYLVHIATSLEQS